MGLFGGSGGAGNDPFSMFAAMQQAQAASQQAALGSEWLVGAGLPSQALDASKTGLGAGNYASANALGAEGNWRAGLGIMTDAYNGAGGLFNAAGDAWGSIYNNRTSLLNAQNEMAMAGPNAILGGLGSIAGMGIGYIKPKSIFSSY